MKRYLVALVAAAILFLTPVASRAQEPRYSIQDLGTLGGDTAAFDLNDAGWVVGSSEIDDGSSHAFLWLPEPALGLPVGIHDLGTLGDGTVSAAFGIDATGRVVGRSQIAAASNMFVLPFLWEQGSMTSLEVPATPFLWGRADAVNAAGDIVGSLEVLGCGPILWLPEPRHGLPAGFNLLPTFAGSFDGVVVDINELGQVVGHTRGPCDTLTREARAYLWLPAPAFGLGAGPHDLLGGIDENFETLAEAISDQGIIVGHRTENAETDEPWMWRNGVFEPLPLPVGSASARAQDVNDLGQVVGSSGVQFAGPFQAVLWEGGEAAYLQDLIPSDSGWTLDVARAINNRGQIVGSGILDGETRAFLLTPIVGSALEIPTLGYAGVTLLALLLAAAGAALLAARQRAVVPPR